MAKVQLGAAAANISVYPNPVTGNSTAVQLNQMPAGLYSVSITNNIGQRLASKIITHAGGSVSEIVDLPLLLAPGTYQLQVQGAGKAFTVQVIKR